MNEPLLSVVVVSRNDDHGGNLLQRMQLFVTGWLEQAKQHNLDSELIIVEWNPLPDRPRLAQALKWPATIGPCAVRIIEVPTEIHERYKYADKLPVFQMIGKNVGIRRARGRFILATNIDILFSNEIMDFFVSGQMTNGHIYRVDRYDVPSDVPDAPINTQLDYCRDHVIRINRRNSTQILGNIQQTETQKISLITSLKKRIREIKNVRDIAELAKDTFITIYSPIHRSVVKPILYGKPLHTNACGDFTLMAREHWLSLRGNAEFQTFSMYLDGLMCAVAQYGGVKEAILEDPARIYHIEHAPGSGWSPGAGAKILDTRLRAAGIPQLNNQDYYNYLRKIRWHFGPTIFNDTDWGLGQETLDEYLIVKSVWDKP